MGIHPDLRRRVFILMALGPLWGLVGAFALIFPFTPAGREAAAPVWLLWLFGMVMLGLSWIMLVAGPRWYCRAGWVLAHTPPEPMLLRLREDRSGDDPTLYAELRPVSGEAGRIECHQVLWPRWRIDLAGEVLARVHRDPRPGGPVVIATERGILWPLAMRLGRRSRYSNEEIGRE